MLQGEYVQSFIPAARAKFVSFMAGSDKVLTRREKNSGHLVISNQTADEAAKTLAALNKQEYAVIEKPLAIQ